MRQPIEVEAHSVIDYGFAAASLAVPLALGFSGVSRAIPMVWGIAQGTLNALTDQPYALRRLVPFERHEQLEAVALPALAVSVLVSRPFD